MLKRARALEQSFLHALEHASSKKSLEQCFYHALELCFYYALEHDKN